LEQSDHHHIVVLITISVIIVQSNSVKTKLGIAITFLMRLHPDLIGFCIRFS